MGSLAHEHILAMWHLEKTWDFSGNPIFEVAFEIILRRAIEDFDSGAAEYPDALPRILKDIQRGRFRFRLSSLSS
jgi:hypothetical protein